MMTWPVMLDERSRPGERAGLSSWILRVSRMTPWPLGITTEAVMLDKRGLPRERVGLSSWIVRMSCTTRGPSSMTTEAVMVDKRGLPRERVGLSWWIVRLSCTMPGSVVYDDRGCRADKPDRATSASARGSAPGRAPPEASTAAALRSLIQFAKALEVEPRIDNVAALPTRQAWPLKI
jgi:hypothetical protein